MALPQPIVIFMAPRMASPGVVDATVARGDVTNGISGYGCIPHPAVVKTTSTPRVTQTPTGTTGEYSIVTTVPAGEGTALAFTISDILPAGFTYAATSAVNLSGGATRTATNNPTAGTSIPAWGTFDIPGGGQVQITFSVNIASTVPPGTYQNPATATYLDPTRTVTTGTATVEYDITDPGEDITIDPPNLPDLTVTKTNNVNGTVAQGSPFNWTIVVANSGGAPATFASGQVVMRDALPGAASYYPQGNLTVNPAGAIACTIATTTLTCTTNAIYTLAAGSSFSVTFQVTPAAAGNLANTAVVDPDGIMPESNENNNTASNTVAVTATATTADLSINKTDGQTTYVPGSVVTYTVTVTNLSGVTANGATVTDNKPANITTWAWVCTTQSGGATGCDPAADGVNNFTDTVNLPVGGTIVYTVTANVSANATGALVNTANIAVPEGITDPDLTNNSSTDDNLPPNTADLSINKTNGQTIYLPGSVVTYTVTVTNLAGVTVTGASVTDDKPANVTTWAWACTTQSGGATGCDPAADGVNNFTDTVNLPVGGTIVYTVTANVSANATGALVNTANIAVPEGITDPDLENNSSTDRDELAGKSADLLLIKSPATKKVDIGDTLTFTLTLTNLGPDDAFDVEVTDKLPSAFTYISSIPSKGTYDSATGIWVVGDMPLNAEETLQISVTVNGADTNVAEVTQSLDGPGGLPLVDPNPDNNLDESKITIKKDDDPTPKPNPFLIPVTGFQPGVVTDLSRVPHESYLATADVTLEIPSLGVKIPIVGVPKKNGTWNVAFLEKQAGWLEGSAFPSWNGNSVLTSHVYLASGKPGPFVSLNKLKFGDKIVVHAYGQKYTFEVQTNTVVPPTDKSMMKHEEKAWLTLVTCKDYDPKTDTYLNRVLVRAVLVSVDWE